jgi:hypothetical protein
MDQMETIQFFQPSHQPAAVVAGAVTSPGEIQAVLVVVVEHGHLAGLPPAALERQIKDMPVAQES